MTFFLLAAAFGGLDGIRLPRSAACLASAVLATMAALRASEVASDFFTYHDWYQYPGDDGDFVPRPFLFESIYFGLSSALSAMEVPFRGFLWIVAAVSVFTKATVLLKFSGRAVASAIALLVYSLTFYLLHDFTQIRAGVAIALLYAAFWVLSNGSRLRAFGLIVLACGFHSSSVFALLFLLPTHGRLSKVVDVTLVLVPLALLGAAFAGFSAGDQLGNWLAQFDPRLSIYVELARFGDTSPANPFSIPALLALALALSLYLGSAPPKETGPTFVRDELGLAHIRRSVLLGICYLALLFSFREIGLRLYEFSISFIPIAAAIVFSRDRMVLPKALIVMWCAATTYVYVFRAGALVAPYAIGAF